MIILCEKCGKYAEKQVNPKVWVMRRVNSTKIERKELCADCTEKLIEFLNSEKEAPSE